MSTVRIPRKERHHGATGKTLQPRLAVGTRTRHGQSTYQGIIVAVRKKKKYAKRYLVQRLEQELWMRRDEFTVAGGSA